MSRARLPVAVAVAVATLVLGACTPGEPQADPEADAGADLGDPPSTGSATGSPRTSPSTPTSSPGATAPESTPSVAPEPSDLSTPVGPARFEAAAAMADVRHLAGRIGPRLATAPAYRRAARFVERRFERLGYDVRRESFPVPGGDSWGVPVAAGRSTNVIAEPEGFDQAGPHLVLGAHLDSVAVSPGAEDNASGVAVLLEVARLAAEQGTRLPVVLIAFGAEEPRGPGDALHHFGSQHHVRELPARRRAAVRAMVALDRVGVGQVVPVCTGPLSPPGVRRALLRAAERVGVPARPCESVTSDHWSFEKDGVVVARLGSTPYAAYHSAADLPRVVDRRQIVRTGRVVWEWLR